MPAEGSEIETMLKEIIAELTEPDKEMQTHLKALGINEYT
ncbi:hypothetical protein PDESU_01940 [Pontiella desulfatans]|uniref:Uncharacterized protein n=1 Tax=Pontiella desulfatans TaxID=2750659 RepID=A0A6C2U0I4_PONDE|nr:hypothetical protein PDESU_01940 [Pontiella desulfatans]